MRARLPKITGAPPLGLLSQEIEGPADLGSLDCHGDQPDYQQGDALPRHASPRRAFAGHRHCRSCCDSPTLAPGDVQALERRIR